MALQKQQIAISFGQGVDTKTDPNQVAAGRMLRLQNAIFDNGGLLKKRNGFGLLTQLPANSGATTLSTFQGNLLATGSSLYSYVPETAAWLSKGIVQPVDLRVSALVRAAVSQSAPDSAIAASGLMCIVYVEASQAYYRVADSFTGQTVVDRVALPATATNPRVFLLGSYFVITFGATVAAAPHLQYLAVSTAAPTTVTAATDISTQFSSISAAYDGYVANNNLYLAWSGNDVGGALRLGFLTSALIASAATILATYTPTLIAVTADTSGNTALPWVSFYSGTTLYVTCRDQNLLSILAPTTVTTSSAINAVGAVAASGVCTTLYQLTASYPSSVRSDSLAKATITQAGLVGGPGSLMLSVGLAAKPFLVGGQLYAVVAHQSSYQPSYFLVNGSGSILARLAYQNGGGYPSTQVLPSVAVSGSAASLAYLYKDNIQSVSKAISGTDKQVFSQLGINLATFRINVSAQYSAELGASLHLTGGQLWQFDGTKPVEHGFHVWPEDVTVTTSASGGNIAAQQYYYQFCYEWTDAQGMLHRSAPSLPIGVVTTGGTSSNTLVVPTLRLTAKVGNNPVRIVGYRWSAGQQSYYMFTSFTAPVVNDATVNTISIADTLADVTILGNTLLYTTGGVIEDIAAPASAACTMFKSRLWLVDAEDRNLLWYSKQVVDASPVEMSDLLTVYVAPTTGTQGSTGEIKALAAMDDKLIIFKQNAIYYLTGNGPDNVGNNNDFSEPTYITSAVGCSNPSSIVLEPQGIQFQSDKGIWLLGRDLSTKYIGDAVEAYNGAQIVSAISVPGTNQVRFTANSGDVLMYDYYFGQWGTFTGVPGISSTLYNGLHTYLNKFGQVLQETPGAYLDGSSPVLLSFTTSWLKLVGLQGFQRAYWFQFLGKYISPHKLAFGIAYDYDSSTSQVTQIVPYNYSAPYGGEPLYGNGLYGGESAVEQWQVYLTRQKCQSVQITFTESYDASLGIPAGAGLTLSGLSLTVGVKAAEPKLPERQSVS